MSVVDYTVWVPPPPVAGLSSGALGGMPLQDIGNVPLKKTVATAQDLSERRLLSRRAHCCSQGAHAAVNHLQMGYTVSDVSRGQPCALGGIRTPNLLIRRSSRPVQTVLASHILPVQVGYDV
jgi:hypothetical protein